MSGNISGKSTASPAGQKTKSKSWIGSEALAKSRNLACRSDDVDNVIIELPATKGYEKSPTVVLQSHVDMVCEKTPESKHDFTKDPIELVERDGWITADGTTLGADNGVGVALSLALLDENIPHPKLELLFTVDEETGLTGANGLKNPASLRANTLSISTAKINPSSSAARAASRPKYACRWSFHPCPIRLPAST